MAEPPLAAVRGFPTEDGPVDLDVRRGDVVWLRGGNGSGKTSLLRALAGLDGPLRPREVRVLGDDPRHVAGPVLAARVRAVWSRPRAGLAGLTVHGEARLRGVAVPAPLAALADRDVATLSAGEAARVALAFAAASPAPLLVLDEPCGALDAAARTALDALVTSARADGAVVVADHSGWAAGHATRTVELRRVADDAFPAIPAATGNVVVDAAPSSVQRGAATVALPALALGPGFHAVTGRNGAGKTTLLERLAGLRDPTGVAIQGARPGPGHNVALLQADAGELLMAPTVAAGLDGVADPEGLVPAALYLRHPLSLSAGEAQRVAAAKALGREAPLHLLDEPEAHLDADGRRRLGAAIARRVAAGACVLAATHDAALLALATTRTEVGA